MQSLLKWFLIGFFRLTKSLLEPLIARQMAKIDLSTKQSFDPTLSAMVSQFNFWHRLIFVPFFRRVATQSSDINQIKNLSQKGPIVFVMKNRGQMEYRYFNHLFLREKIPPILYANNCLTLFWWPWRLFWHQVILKLSHFYQDLEKTETSESLAKLLKRNSHVLLNLSISRDYLFGLIRTNPLDTIRPLIELQKNTDTPITIINVQFLYDKHPDKSEESYFDLFFGDKSRPGAIRKFILFWLNYQKKPQAKFGAPVNLKEFVAESVQTEDISENLLRKIEQDLRVEKARITGPTLISKESIIKRILSDTDFNTHLSGFAHSTGKKFERLKKDAEKYLNEIGADVNYSYIHFFHITLSYLWNHIFDGHVVKHDSLAKIREVAGKNPIVLVPMHRSHIDYLLISDIFYERNITFPHVCGGINLNFWPVGRLIRKCGGFFIRRSFDGNKVYKESLYAYIKTLIHAGYCMEFFIEGTRSRTGKLLKPKMGILSLILRAFANKAASDIIFVPIAITYDQILEQKSYQAENSGADKKKEAALELLKVRKIFNKKYGKVYIEFADPISLKAYCHNRDLGDMAILKKTVNDFAYHLTYNINKVAIVTPTAMVSLALLSLNKSSFTFDELMERIKPLKAYLNFKGASYSDLINYSDRYAYGEAINKLCSRNLLKEVHTFEESFYKVEDRTRLDLDYYKNNILHFFVSLACFCKILAGLKEHESITVEGAIKNFETLKTLLRQDFTFSARDSTREHLMRVVTFCQKCGFVRHLAESETLIRTLHPENTKEFFVYQGLLDNFFESHLITLRYLRANRFQKQEKKGLITDILEKSKPLYLKGDLHHPESLSRFNLENTLKVFLDLGLVSSEMDEKNRVLFTSRGELELVETWIGSVQGYLNTPTSFAVNTQAAETQSKAVTVENQLH